MSQIPAGFEVDSLPIEDVVGRIIGLVEQMCARWSDAHGWAPHRAADLLSRSRLDRQVSLARCLSRWLPESSGDDLTDGELILAWANLGAVLEGSLKTLLCVYFEDFAQDAAAPHRRSQLVFPDGLGLEQLRQFFVKRGLLPEHHDYIAEVQQRRNAIHAFEDRDIGSSADFEEALRRLLQMLVLLNTHLPDPAPW